MKVRKSWEKNPKAQKKLGHLQNEARADRAVTHSDSAYQEHRKRSPGEFEKEKNKDGVHRGPNEDWDHMLDIGCGGTHEPDNIDPLDSAINRSVGSVLAAACRKLCEGTRIKDIVYEYVLDEAGKLIPGADKPPFSRLKRRK